MSESKIYQVQDLHILKPMRINSTPSASISFEKGHDAYMYICMYIYTYN